MPLPKNQRVTTKDIARYLKLNPSTVSRALRNQPHVAARTRAQVRKAAKKLGYREDPALKSLIAYRWNPRRQSSFTTVAVILDQAGKDQPIPAERKALDLARQRAASMGYVLECFYLRDYPSPAALSRMLFHRGIAGVLIGRTTQVYDGNGFLFDWDAFSAVAVDAGVTALPCHNVLANHFKVLLSLWRTLVASGYQRIGAVLRNDLLWRVHPQEIGAFCYGQLNIPAASRVPICFHDPATQSGKLLQWFHACRPEVVIGRDLQTFAALKAGGLRLPQDVRFAALELTGVSDVRAAGFALVDSSFAEALILLDSLLRLNRRGIPEERHVLLISPRWIPGPTLPGVASLVL